MKTPIFYRSLSACLTLLVLFLGQACRDDDSVTAPFAVNRLYPDKGASGETISISGSGFSSDGKVVTFNGKKARIESVVGDTLLKAIVPDGVTTGFVEVRFRQTTIAGPLFTVLRNPNPPALVSLSTDAAEAGEVIAINGKNFAFGTDSALQRNIVRVGGVRTSVVGGTSTELRVVMPALPEGTHELSVTILSAQSNALPVAFQRFDGTLFWPDVPGPGAWQSGATQSYMLSARADGGTRLKDKNVLEIPGHLGSVEGNYPRSIINTFNPVTNTLFYRFVPTTTYQPTLRKVTLPWSDDQEVMDGTNPDLQEKQIGFSNIWLLGSVPGPVDRFYTYLDNNQGGSEGTPYRFLATGTADGEDFSEFGNSVSEQFYPEGILNTFLTPEAAAVSEDYLVYSQESYDPITFDMLYTVHHVPLSGNPKPVPTGVVLRNRRIWTMTYSPGDGNFYAAVGDVNESETHFSIYRLAGDGTGLELITNKITSKPRALTVLPADTGLKLYWIAPTPSTVDAVWMLNLKGGNDALPVVLYGDMQEIFEKPETRITDSFQAFYPPYICTFLCADK
jgi:hypothetical protein